MLSKLIRAICWLLAAAAALAAAAFAGLASNL